MSYKQSQKILVIDGEKLKTEPFGVMNRVQDFLDIDKIDYSRLIKFDKNKGRRLLHPDMELPFRFWFVSSALFLSI